MKKLTVILFTLLLVLALSACGGGNDNVAENNDSANNTANNTADNTADNTDVGNNTENNTPNNTPANNNTDAAHPEAVALYQQQCISCHATDLSGGMGEQSNLQKVGARLSKEEIADQIKNGGQMMPPQTDLSDDQIELLANWLVTKK